MLNVLTTISSFSYLIDNLLAKYNDINASIIEYNNNSLMNIVFKDNPINAIVKNVKTIT